MARRGYSVDIYERFPVPGGVMWTGVPEWRLPRDVIAEEVSLITDLGVRVHYNTDVGKDVHLKDLAEKHDAVVLKRAGEDRVRRVVGGGPAEDVFGTRLLEALGKRADL